MARQVDIHRSVRLGQQVSSSVRNMKDIVSGTELDRRIRSFGIWVPHQLSEEALPPHARSSSSRQSATSWLTMYKLNQAHKQARDAQARQKRPTSRALHRRPFESKLVHEPPGTGSAEKAKTANRITAQGESKRGLSNFIRAISPPESTDRRE